MPKQFSHMEEEIHPENLPLRCKRCGEENCIEVWWSERTYGTADVLNHDSELGNYETQESDNFSIDSFKCTSCNLDGSHLYDVALEIGEEFEEPEEVT